LERWKKIACLLFLGSAVSKVLSSLLKNDVEWLKGILTFGLFFSLAGWHLLFKNSRRLNTISKQAGAMVLLFSLSMLAQWSKFQAATTARFYFSFNIHEVMDILSFIWNFGVAGFSYGLWRIFMIQRIRVLRPVFFALAFLFSLYILFIYMPRYEESVKYLCVNPLPSSFHELLFDHLFWCMTALWLVLLFTFSFGRSYLQREYRWMGREDAWW